jgi:hypothetical protein
MACCNSAIYNSSVQNNVKDLMWQVSGMEKKIMFFLDEP